MPLVHIHVVRGRDEAELRVLLDAIHAAQVDAFSVPETDRYQLLTQHDPHEMIALDTGLGFERTEQLVVLHVVSRARTRAQKERLFALLAQYLEERAGVPSAQLIVSITENGDADWSFGGGRAQFLTRELG